MMNLTQVGKYELLDEVGHGGMAVVYRGRDKSLDREVAVKILHPHLAKHAEAKRRFQREAQAVAKLRHENIVEIYDYSGYESKQSYIVTEFIHGTTLKAFLHHRPISHPEIAVMIVLEVSRAVAHAHRSGIIHRDIKPENIMVREDGRIKLMDFGIAQMIDMQELTLTGQLLGSPAYMAPELIEGRTLDFRADLFSLGTLLYELTTGKLPFSGKNPHEVLRRIGEGKYLAPEMANPLVCRSLSEVIAKALAHNPADRFPSMEAFEAALEQFLAAVGINDAPAELISYFQDPTTYGQQFQERIVSALLERGKSAFRQSDRGKALMFFDRLLCYDSRHREATQYVRRFARRRLRNRSAAALTLFGFAAIVGWLVYANLRTELSSLTAPQLAAARSTALPVGVTKANDPPPTVAKDQARTADLPNASISPPDEPREKKKATEPRPREKKQSARTSRSYRSLLPRTIEIIPTPKAMRIWLNDRALGAYGPTLRRVTLPAGPAILTFRNEECCYERVIKLGSNDRPRSLRVSLPWKPGRVVVRVEPSVDARVLIGGIVAGVNELVSVPIPSYVSDGRTEVDVRVSAEGFRTVKKRIKVRANQAEDLTIQLEPKT